MIRQFILRIIRRIRLYPFTEDDLRYPCRIFAYDAYTGCFGCEIIKEDTRCVIWTGWPDRHPNITRESAIAAVLPKPMDQSHQNFLDQLDTELSKIKEDYVRRISIG